MAEVKDLENLEQEQAAPTAAPAMANTCVFPVSFLSMAVVPPVDWFKHMKMF